MSNIVLCNLSDVNSTIEEVRDEWIVDVLTGIGVSEEDFNLPYDQYCDALSELGLVVRKSTGGTVSVYKLSWHEEDHCQGFLNPTKNNLIAQWKNPKRVKRIENNDVYYELHFDCWSFV